MGPSKPSTLKIFRLGTDNSRVEIQKIATTCRAILQTMKVFISAIPLTITLTAGVASARNQAGLRRRRQMKLRSLSFERERGIFAAPDDALSLYFEPLIIIRRLQRARHDQRSDYRFRKRLTTRSKRSVGADYDWFSRWLVLLGGYFAQRIASKTRGAITRRTHQANEGRGASSGNSREKQQRDGVRLCPVGILRWEQTSGPDEQPVHQVTFARGFYSGR